MPEDLVLAVYAVFLLLEVALTVAFVRQMRRPSVPLRDEECPPLVAVLCLRGGDPFLHRTLSALFSQDYPRYRVRLVLDTAQDPALSLVQAALRGCTTPVDVLALEHRCENCSGKNCSLLRATEDLPPETKIVAVIDGDAVLHRSCLRELAEPIVRREAWVGSGNRWYSPEPPSLGSHCRFLWNVNAIALMQVLEIPWDGCIALRAEMFVDLEFRQRLGTALAGDQTMITYARARGVRTEFVPAATLVNRENCSLRSFYNFLVRQYTCVRMHNSRWWLCFAYGVSTSALATLVPLLLLLWPATRKAAMIGVGLLVLVVYGKFVAERRSLRRIVRRRGERLERWTLDRTALTLPTIPIFAVVNILALCQAVVARTHVWRGIVYRFGRNPRVQVVHVTPMADLPGSTVAQRLGDAGQAD